MDLGSGVWGRRPWIEFSPTEIFECNDIAVKWFGPDRWILVTVLLRTIDAALNNRGMNFARNNLLRTVLDFSYHSCMFPWMLYKSRNDAR